MTPDPNLKTLSEIHGWLKPFYTHQFRYGSGKLLDESGFVSGAQMNVIMNHASMDTFVKHYRTRRHANLQEVMCGLDPDREWERALTGQNRLRDLRRPRHLTSAERRSVEQDPELLRAIARRRKANDLARSSDADMETIVCDLDREITNLRQRLLYRLRKDVRREFSRKQAVIDIGRQLSGDTAYTEAAERPSRRESCIPPTQMHLLECLMSVPKSDCLEDECQRRNKAVEAVRQYCGFLKGGPLRGRRPQKTHRDNSASPDIDTNANHATPAAVPSWEAKFLALEEHIRSAAKPKACFQCRKEFSRYADVLRHFRSAHLQDRQCNFCVMILPDQMSLQLHASAVHRLETCPRFRHYRA